MFRLRLPHLVALAVVPLGAAALAVSPALAAGPHDARGQVFEATNDPSGNAIQVFDRKADGTLVAGDVVGTGGLGSGDSLGSQGAVVRDGRHVLVVNAGDSTVSSLVIRHGGLELRDVAPSDGTRPVSVTVHDHVVYVLNTGSDSISGFRLSEDGDLRPLANSTRPLSGAHVGAAQIQFSNDGRQLVVTEKTTAKIDIFRVGERGLAGAATVFESNGAVPYGFDIDRHNTVIVSEAAGGAVSSYRLHHGQLDSVTASQSDTQAAPCWLEISRNGKFAFTTNAASGTISSYSIAADSSISLLAAVAAGTSAGPTDLAQSEDGRYLYVRVRSGAVAAYGIGGDGSLTPLGEFAGAPSIGTSGLAAS